MKYDKMITTVVNSIGYAFEQCMSSDIEIDRKIVTDDDQLATLKDLAAAYREHLKIGAVDVSSLHNSIDEDIIERVLSAKCLADCYKQC